MVPTCCPELGRARSESHSQDNYQHSTLTVKDFFKFQIELRTVFNVKHPKTGDILWLLLLYVVI